jgi:hypothetical protein
MSILKPEPVPVRVVGVLRTLHKAGASGLTFAQLQDLMHPESVWSPREREKEDANAMVWESLEVCVDLGLAQAPEKEGDAYRLADDVQFGDLQYEDCVKEFARRILGGRGAAEKSGDNHYEQFCWMLAWYLEQPPGQWPAEADDLTRRVGDWEQLGFKKIQPSPHFDQFLYWSEALGILSLLRLHEPGRAPRD